MGSTVAPASARRKPEGTDEPRFPSPSLVDLPTVSDRQDQNEKHTVMDLVHDPVVTCSNAPLPVAADEFLGTWRARFDRQQFDTGLNP